MPYRSVGIVSTLWLGGIAAVRQDVLSGAIHFQHDIRLDDSFAGLAIRKVWAGSIF